MQHHRFGEWLYSIPTSLSLHSIWIIEYTTTFNSITDRHASVIVIEKAGELPFPDFSGGRELTRIRRFYPPNYTPPTPRPLRTVLTLRGYKTWKHWAVSHGGGQWSGMGISTCLLALVALETLVYPVMLLENGTYIPVGWEELE